ncbi:MAG TPA: EthD family reductase [Spongiibacteraceae bacterium]|nr:EthD family reductase [Spongiibacteraceae bacterium]
MIRVAILYPNTPGSTFDAAYYREKHLVLARELLTPELTAIEFDVGIAGAKGAAPFHGVGYLSFQTMEAFQQAFARASAQLGEDVPKYTNVEPTLQISSYEKLL